MGPKLVHGGQLESSGDEKVYAGDLPSAKERYGDAIDAYLAERDYDSAIRTCRKLIRLAPDVVRTHYTLAYLLVGRRQHQEALDALHEYSLAVQATHNQSYATPLLTLLAYVTESPEVRAGIARILTRVGTLGDAPGSGEHEEILRQASDIGVSPQERWERLLPIALRGL